MLRSGVVADTLAESCATDCNRPPPSQAVGPRPYTASPAQPYACATSSSTVPDCSGLDATVDRDGYCSGFGSRP